MNYKSMLIELANYFKVVNSWIDSNLDEMHELMFEQNIEALKDYMRKMQEGFPTDIVHFSPKEVMNMLYVKMPNLQYIQRYNSYVHTFIIKSYKLSPQSQYAYYYSQDTEELFFEQIYYKQVSYSIRFPLRSYLIVELYLLPTSDLSFILNYALNYKVMKAVMKPEHFKYVEKSWRILFGDME